MKTEVRVRRATSAARRLQTLNKGEVSYLVLANSDDIDYMDTGATQQNLEYLAQWSIPGVIVTSGADAVWIELLPDHDYPHCRSKRSQLRWSGPETSIPSTTHPSIARPKYWRSAPPGASTLTVRSLWGNG
jgi:hypothetical protein